MEFPKAKILLADDEANVRLTVEAILRHEGYDVDTVPDGETAIRAIRERQYDLLLTDLKMPGTDGLAVLAAVQKHSPDTVTLMMTGYGSMDSALEAMEFGAYEYLLKPVEVLELKMAVQRSLERKRLSEIDTLYRIGQELANALDPESIRREVRDAACRVLRCSEAGLIALDSNIATTETGDLADVLADRELLAKLQAGEIVTNGGGAVARWAEVHRITAFALVPGIAGQRLVCVLWAHNGEHAYEFHASAQRFLRGLANQTAMALANTALIRQLQANNAELATANEKLRELDKLKSQFLSVATHELRTPLSVILGYNSMLAENLSDRLGQDEKQLVEDSVASCKRLIRLVNSMLDINQIEAGKMKMNFASSDVRHVVTGVVNWFQQEARNRGLNLSCEVPSRLPRVQIDTERIEQVLINLIGNALKFTPSGGAVRVRLRQRGDDAVEIAVSDTGIGILPEDQESIFDEFTQVRRQAANRQREGSGLGLAIVKRIVEAHRGVISVTSEPQRGSTFVFSLPFAARQRSTTTAVSA